LADDVRALRAGRPGPLLRALRGQNQFKLHLAVTYVAVVDGRIVGFATVAASSMERANIPSARLRKRLPKYPLPVLRLGRLGIDTRAQGLGIGNALLRHVLGLALDQRECLGCVGVVTDAKSEALAFYEALGFTALDGVREGLLVGQPLPMFLNGSSSWPHVARLGAGGG
jgi:GNAT superfamily N-acetyltransferase